jgi:hypothetical protein
MESNKTMGTPTTRNRQSHSARRGMSEGSLEWLGHLARLHASLRTALSLAQSPVFRENSEARRDLPFRLDAIAFAVAVDSRLFFGMSEGNFRISPGTKDRVRSLAEAAARLARAIGALDEPNKADPCLSGSLRNMEHIAGRLKKGLDALFRSWIVADLCFLALLGRAKARGACHVAGTSGPAPRRSSMP